VGGHSGIQATYQRVKRLFAWSGLKTDVENFVKQCGVCQHAKHELTHPAGLLQPLPIPKGAWRDLSLDFIEGLPLSDGSNVILVVVDRFTKFSHFIPLRHPFTAQFVARVFVDSVVKLHGVPLTLVSDRDKIFTSAFWRELFKILGTRLQFSTAYHPQTDGQTERVNQCLEMYLRCMVSDCPKQWRKWLPLAELWYNSNYHSSLGCSPFKALYGADPNLGAMPVDTANLSSSVTEFLAERNAQLESLKQHLESAQVRMKSNADKHRAERSFQVGELVLLKLQSYTMSSVANRPYPKLAFKFFGPYRVLQKIGSVAYKLELPADSQVHPIFYVSQLKSFTPDFSLVFSDLSKVAELDTGQQLLKKYWTAAW
jgi:hypothetical protein